MAGEKQAGNLIDTTITTNINVNNNNAPLYPSARSMSPRSINLASMEGGSSSGGGIESSEDLKLWLEFTRFHDVDFRNKILHRLRQLRLLDEQRSQIVSELQGASGGLPFAAALSSLSPLENHHHHHLGSSNSMAFTSQPQSAALSISSATSSILPSAAHKTGQVGDASVGAAHPFASSAMTTSTAQSGETGGDSAVPHHHHDHNHRDRYSVASTEESNPSGGDDAEVESNPDNIPRYKPPGHLKSIWALPQLHEPDLMKDSRFFLIKSFNAKNVEMSQKDGLWVTKVENGQLLTDAFNKSKNVYLFYSVNKSRCFQGYARMLTAPSTDIGKAKWMSNLHWETSPPFRVDWINTRDTEFWELGKIRNDFDDNQKVFVGRDGLEYSGSCGRKLMAVMDKPPAAVLPAGAKKKEKWWASKLKSWNDESEGQPPPGQGGWERGSLDDSEAVDCSNWRSTRSPKPGTDSVADGHDHTELNLIDY